jgi:predicted esterase
MSILLIETPTHGRVIVREPTAPTRAGLLVGFHGYAETAEIQIARLAAVPGADAWTLLSVQALHRFYRGRSEEVVSSWMTRQDRDTAIADNVRYVDAAIAAVRTSGSNDPIVYAGFSQGVAMAFRSAVLGRWPGAGVVAVGGDVPPELLADGSLRFPDVLMVRGTADEWYTQARFESDVEGLKARSCRIEPVVFDGGHEWSNAASESAGTFLSSVQRS